MSFTTSGPGVGFYIRTLGVSKAAQRGSSVAQIQGDEMLCGESGNGMFTASPHSPGVQEVEDVESESLTHLPSFQLCGLGQVTASL